MTKTSYLIALGSNRRHHRYGDPRRVVTAAATALGKIDGIKLQDIAPIISTVALGPAGRSFANGALLIRSRHDPRGLIAILKTLEKQFGRRRGRRWGPRVIDLDIILWSEGLWVDPQLTIPHPGYRQRRFVLDPLTNIASGWRDPLTGLSVRQARARLTRPKPVDPGRSAP